MLVIWRRAGRGMFIGRTVRVTVLEVFADKVKLGIEAPLGVAVSGPQVASDEHLIKQVDRETDAVPGNDTSATEVGVGETLSIGRGVRVVFKGREREQQATLLIDAPRNVAVTRDDFTRDEHLAKQERLENGVLSEV